MVQATDPVAASLADPVTTPAGGDSRTAPPLATTGTEELLLALFRTVRGTQAMSATGPVDFGVRRLLGVLAQHGALRLSELAQIAQLDLSTVSRHVTRLTADGLVARTADPDDGRACQVQISDDGRATLRTMLQQHAAAVAPVLDRWDPTDRAALLALLQRLAADLQTAAHGTPAPSPRPGSQP